MGATTARITAEDFVTPPELAQWSLATQSAGRIGGVRLELSVDSNETRLSQCYQQIPLRVLPPFQFGPGQPSLVYLLNPTAGLMDGDAHRMQIHARQGSRALVVGQSATRIHPGVHGFCTQQWNVYVEAGAVLVVLPGPAIPFRGCRYAQVIRIDLEDHAGLVWGDLWYAGRYARGEISERFEFERLIQDFTVYRKEQLIFRDRFAWQGPWDEKTAAWYFGAQLACGSLFATGPMEDSILLKGSNFETGHFQTAAKDSCVRWLGPSEEITTAMVTTVLTLAGNMCGGQSPWLFPFHNLGPNHWFMPTHCPRDTVPRREDMMGTPSGSGRPATSNS